MHLFLVIAVEFSILNDYVITEDVMFRNDAFPDKVHMVTDNKVIITVTINIPPGFQNNPSP